MHYNRQEVLYKKATDENCTESMTVYVLTINGKTISIKCNKEQAFERIKDEVERETKIPKDHVNQGKALKVKTTIEESNIIAVRDT